MDEHGRTLSFEGAAGNYVTPPRPAATVAPVGHQHHDPATPMPGRDNDPGSHFASPAKTDTRKPDGDEADTAVGECPTNAADMALVSEFERRTTRAVNTAYSRRLVVGGDRALVVHFTHNPALNLSPAEQLLGMARVAIPALCNYLYFRAGKLAVAYFGKTRNEAGRKVGVVGGDDMKQKLLRYLTIEIWPPLPTCPTRVAS
jgi:hypothetical protein